MHSENFKEEILQGIPDELPPKPLYDQVVKHARVRKDILSVPEKKPAIKNALKYFPLSMHGELSPEFLNDLISYCRRGRMEGGDQWRFWHGFRR